MKQRTKRLLRDETEWGYTDDGFVYFILRVPEDVKLCYKMTWTSAKHKEIKGYRILGPNKEVLIEQLATHSTVLSIGCTLSVHFN